MFFTVSVYCYLCFFVVAQVTRKALPIVVACCFYLATCYTNESSTPIDPDSLMSLSQCEATREIFLEVVGRIRDEVSFCQQRPVTPLSFLRLFYSVFELNDGLLQNGDIRAFLITRLELLLCQFEFTKFRVSKKSSYLVYLIIHFAWKLNSRFLCDVIKGEIFHVIY